jgi:hypothetical protein
MAEIFEQIEETQSLFSSGSIEESKSKLNPLLFTLMEESGSNEMVSTVVSNIKSHVSSSNPFND